MSGHKASLPNNSSDEEKPLEMRLFRRPVSGMHRFRSAKKGLLTNVVKTVLMLVWLLGVQIERIDNLFFCKATIVHDKGKPAARQGRKAVSLQPRGRGDCLVAEGSRREP